MYLPTKRGTRMATGTVVWFNRKVGYGFIRNDEDNKDIFVHIAAINESGLKSLYISQRVNFELGEWNGRNIAQKISLILA